MFSAVNSFLHDDEFSWCLQSSCRLPSLPLKPSLSSELFVVVVYSIPCRHTLNTQCSSLICAAAVSDRLALLGTSSLQGKCISKVEFLKSCNGVVKLKVHFGVPPEKVTPIPHSLSVSVLMQRSVREVAELYGCEKSLPAVEAHRPLSGLHSIALSALESSVLQTNTSEAPPTVNELCLHLHTVNHDGVTFIDTRSERFYVKLQRRRRGATSATPGHPAVDDEAVYYNVAGECPRGRVYGLGSLGRKKKIYADPGFGVYAEAIRDDHGRSSLSQPQPPPPPHEHQQPQTDPADPPQQHNNVDKEIQDWLTRDEQLGILSTPKELLGGADDGAGPVVVFSSLEVLENKLDSS
ncbi:hypothetical protein Scep_016597 [Stephania cephalantha]|uniref:Uncharacterized protein n=1 Tax=Stephania cephalantha TaxID=152367 RepID=A0AAP0IMY1_9MAGN